MRTIKLQEATRKECNCRDEDGMTPTLWAAFEGMAQDIGDVSGDHEIGLGNWHRGRVATHAQSDFSQLYKVKCENMKNLDCLSLPMVCGPMFQWCRPPGAKRVFLPMVQRGYLSELIFSMRSPL